MSVAGKSEIKNAILIAVFVFLANVVECTSTRGAIRISMLSR